MKPTCPTCGRAQEDAPAAVGPLRGAPKKPGAPARGPFTAAPFCSARCRNADLGKWLSESYRIGAPVSDEDLDEGSRVLPDTPES